MRKILAIALMSVFALNSWAQEVKAKEEEKLVNKKGKVILPEKESFGLGFNAVPFFNYLGNMFNGTQNNSINVDFVNSAQTIYAKYFINDNMAVRAEFRFGQMNSTVNNWVVKDGATTPDDYVEDIKVSSQSIGLIGVGIERRRGWDRIQAFYGLSVFYSFESATEAFSYGNEFSSTNVTPTSTIDFGTGSVAQLDDRVVYRRTGQIHGYGARLFAGIEYFFAPQMSIGGEFGWAMAGRIQGNAQEGRHRYTTQEEEYVKKASTNNAFKLDTDNFNGSINLMIYFK